MKSCAATESVGTPLDAGQPTVLLALAGLNVGLLTFVIGMASAGFLGLQSLVGTVLGMVLAWWALLSEEPPFQPGRRLQRLRRLGGRIVIGTCVALATVICMRNLHNILWSGSAPLLPADSCPEVLDACHVHT